MTSGLYSGRGGGHTCYLKIEEGGGVDDTLAHFIEFFMRRTPLVSEFLSYGRLNFSIL